MGWNFFYKFQNSFNVIQVYKINNKFIDKMSFHNITQNILVYNNKKKVTKQKSWLQIFKIKIERNTLGRSYYYFIGIIKFSISLFLHKWICTYMYSKFGNKWKYLFPHTYKWLWKKKSYKNILIKICMLP